MKLNYILPIILASLFLSCNSNQNSDEFIKKANGRYLYNSDEVIQIYFEENELFMNWRGAKSIKPLKVDENTFFVKEMNEKIQFLTNPSNQQDYIVLVQKEKDEPIKYNFKKLKTNEKVPSEYLKNNEFNKALEGYLTLQKKDSLDTAIIENNFNSLGYQELREKNYKKAIHIFEINVALYPNSSNVYDSLAEAFMKRGDTIKAIENYKKSLTLDSGNKRAKRNIEKMEKKIVSNK
jgi:tetratricopeptide (TPR) repeat protein